MISAIQQDTASAVESMAGSSAQVAEGKTLVDATGSQLARIVATVSNVTEMIQDISSQAEAQSAVSNLVSQTMSEVAGISQDNKMTVGEMIKEAMLLMQTASALKQSVEIFKLHHEHAVAADANLADTRSSAQLF